MLRHITLHFECLSRIELPLIPEAQISAFLLSFLGDVAHDQPRGFWARVQRGSQVDFLQQDRYVFGLVFFSDAPAALEVDTLLAGLRRLPDAGLVFAAHMPLQNNLRLTAVRCARSQQLLSAAAQAQAFAATDLAAQSALPAQRLWRWQWLSPARLLKVGPGRPRAGEARFVANESELDFALLWRRVLGGLDAHAARLGPELAAALAVAQASAAPKCRIVAQEQFWLNAHYRSGRAGGLNPTGGLMGEALIQVDEPLSAAALGLWLCASYLGIGQRRSFGLGQFALLPAQFQADDAATPSVLARMLEPARWQAAYTHVQAGAHARVRQAPLNSQFIEADSFDPERAARLAQQLVRATFSVAPLRRVALGKADGSVRSLAVPPFWDRIAQRVLLGLIAPQLHALEADASFGFRSGRSRQQARDQLLRLQRAGFEHVLDSDVDDFFDSVDPWRIRVRLRALFGADPVVELILAWITAPQLNADGTQEPRARGLPQGSPLSPLLSNLLLADFDSDLTNAGFALVRFADDFVVACKSPEQAKQALELARASLAEKGLQLKASKTAISSFSLGFDFLGYRFAGGLALEIKQRMPIVPDAALTIAAPERFADSALASWEAAAPEPKAEPLELDDAAPAPANAAAAAACALGEYLLLAGAPHKLSRDQGQWLVQAGAFKKVLPGERLAAIVLVGVQHLSTGALNYALELGTPVHFVSSSGKYRGVLQPIGAGVDAALWRAQDAHFSDPGKALRIAQKIVHARIGAQRETLRQRDLASQIGNHVGNGFDALLRQVAHVDSIASLRGYEGQAAKLYFAALAQLLERKWLFDGRVRRPPTDAFNVLLSFGYSVLSSIANTWVHALGLCPSSAPYHVAHGQKPALALDMIEPLRHWVERTALNQLRRNEVKPEDFSARPGGGLIMLPDARKRYIAALMQRFGRGDIALTDKPHSADAIIRLMLWRLNEEIRGQGEFAVPRALG